MSKLNETSGRPPPKGARIEAVRVRGSDDPRLPQLLVDVITEDGQTGTGEAWWGIANPAADRAPHAPYATIMAAIEGVLAPRCIGRNANDIEAIGFDLHDYAARYGDGGVITMALSGIDLALWDRLGKRLGVPVNQLLGGCAHESLPAYASLPPLRTAAIIDSECRRALAAGYRAVKLHEVSVEAVRWAREAIGPDAALMVDCNGHFNLHEAIAFARAIAPYNVLWLEEPVRPMRDIASLARVAAASPVPLAAGENEYALADFSRMLEARAVTWLQPEITKIGGLSAARRVSTLVELHNVALSPHNFRLGPSLYASMHWGFACPATEWLEVPWMPADRVWPSRTPMPVVVDGRVRLGDAPGFGLDV